MSILNKVSSGKKGRAQKTVIYAPEGFGKSTLAAQFPNPLFLDVEDSTSQLDVRRLNRSDLPDLRTVEAALAEIAKEKPCASLIVDTIDWLEQMVTDDIIASAKSDKITGIEDFGYGKGYTILRERVTILLAKFDTLIASGIHVVLLAHSNVKKFEPPDGAGPYDRYELKLSKQVAPIIKEWADMVLFGNWRTQVRERDKNESGAQFKGVGGKERLLYCNRSAAWDAKNRHNLGDTEKWDIATIEKAFREAGAPWLKAATQPTAIFEKANEPVAKITPAGIASMPKVEDPKDDEIPGIANPKLAAVVDAELERILAPHTDEVTAYLLAGNRIKPGQTWRDLDAGFASRIKKNPAGFLKVAVKVKEAA